MRKSLILVVLSAWPSVSAGQAPQEHTRLSPVVVADRYGYIDAAGKMIIPPRFQFAGEFSAGLAEGRVADQWGCIHTTGAGVIRARVDMTARFCEGGAVVEHGGNPGLIYPPRRLFIEPRVDVSP